VRRRDAPVSDEKLLLIRTAYSVDLPRIYTVTHPSANDVNKEQNRLHGHI
jgi:hypothetical protein